MNKLQAILLLVYSVQTVLHQTLATPGVEIYEQAIEDALVSDMTGSNFGSILPDTKLIQKLNIVKGVTEYRYTDSLKKGDLVFIGHWTDYGKPVIVLRSSVDPTKESKRTFVVMRQSPFAEHEYIVFYAYLRTPSPNNPLGKVIRIGNENLVIEWDVWDDRGFRNLGKLFGFVDCKRSLTTACKSSFADGYNQELVMFDEMPKGIDSEKVPKLQELSNLMKNSLPKLGPEDFFADLQINELEREFTAKTVRYLALAEAIVKSLSPSLEYIFLAMYQDLEMQDVFGYTEEKTTNPKSEKRNNAINALSHKSRDEISRSLGKALEALVFGVEDIAATVLALNGQPPSSIIETPREGLFGLGKDVLKTLMTKSVNGRKGIPILLQPGFIEKLIGNDGEGPLAFSLEMTREYPLEKFIDLEATTTLLDSILPKFTVGRKTSIFKGLEPIQTENKEIQNNPERDLTGYIKKFRTRLLNYIQKLKLKELWRLKRSIAAEKSTTRENGRGLLDGLLGLLGLNTNGNTDTKVEDNDKSSSAETLKKHTDDNSEEKDKKEKDVDTDRRKREGAAEAVGQTLQQQQAALLRALLLAKAQQKLAEQQKQLAEQAGLPAPDASQPAAAAGLPASAPAGNNEGRLALLQALLEAERKMKERKAAEVAASSGAEKEAPENESNQKSSSAAGASEGLSGGLDGILQSLTGGDPLMLGALISGSTGGKDDILMSVLGPGGELVGGLVQTLNLGSILSNADGNIVTGLVGNVLGGGLSSAAKTFGGILSMMQGKGKKKGTSEVQPASGGGGGGGAKFSPGGIIGKFMGGGGSRKGGRRVSRSIDKKEKARALLTIGALTGKRKDMKTTAVPKKDKNNSTETEESKENSKETETTTHSAAPPKKKGGLLGVLGRKKRKADTKEKKHKDKKAEAEETTTAPTASSDKKKKKDSDKKDKDIKKKKKSSSSSESAESKESKESKESGEATAAPKEAPKKKKMGLLGGLLGRRRRSVDEFTTELDDMPEPKSGVEVIKPARSIGIQSDQDLFTNVGWTTQTRRNAKKFGIPLYGWGLCLNAGLPTKNEFPLEDWYLDTYLTILQTNCDPTKRNVLEYLQKEKLVFYDGMAGYTVLAEDLRTNKKLTQSETEYLSVAFELAAFSKTAFEIKQDEENSIMKTDIVLSPNVNMLMLSSHRYLSMASKLAPAHLVMLTRNVLSLLRTAIVRLVADYHKYSLENNPLKNGIFVDIFHLEGLSSFIINWEDSEVPHNHKESEKLFRAYFTKNYATIKKAAWKYCEPDIPVNN